MGEEQMNAPRVARMFGNIQVVIDRDVCCGYKACVAELEEVFEMGEDGIVRFVQEKPAATVPERSAILEACRICPVGALEVVDSSTGDVLVP